MSSAKQPKKHFDVVTYTGNGGTQSIDSLEFSPDLVWIKNRDQSASHHLYDTVRGVNLRLASDSTAAELDTGDFPSFDTNGFTVGNSTQVNSSGNKHVAWCWNAGDETVTNKVLNCFKRTKNKRKKSVKIEFRRVSHSDFSINRRRSALSFKNGLRYQMQNLPNFKKPVDENIDLIDFIDIKTKKNLAKIIKVNCHPVASPKNLVGSDYIGYLRKDLHNKTDHVFFLQGLCGDIRPKIIKINTTLKDHLIKILIGDRFRKPNIFDAKIIGIKIANLIKKVSKKNTESKAISIGKCYKRNLYLKLKNGKTFKKKTGNNNLGLEPCNLYFF